MGRRWPLSSSPLWVFLILSTLFSLRANASNVVVIGSGDCADCAEKKIEKAHALSGLKVTIDCVAPNGEVKTRGASVLKKDGEFNVELSDEVVDHSGSALKEECYVQFHSASKLPCPAHNDLEKTSKIVFKSKEQNGEKLIFTTVGKMNINPELCSSEYLWHYWQHPPSPYPVTYSHPWLTAPPVPYYQHPWFKHPPLYSTPPVVPIYKPPVVFHKPPVVIYKPPVIPIHKPPVVIYKPPVVPIHKPPVVIYKPPVVPIHKPPAVIYKPPIVFHKPPVIPIHKPPIVIYKPPIVYHKPPVIPIHKPPIVIYKPPIIYHKPPVIPFHKPPIVIYKPPVIYKKPWPPLPPHPWGIYKKPWPPLPPHPWGIYKKPWPPLPPQHPWLPPSKS